MSKTESSSPLTNDNHTTMTPPAKGKAPISIRLSLIFVGLSLLLKLVGTFWIRRQISHLTREYSYVGDDYPDEWPLEREKVVMQFDNPKRFRLDSEDGVAEWAALIPGDGLVHLGPSRQPYTIGMVHQLKCLNIIREEMVRDRTKDDRTPSMLGRHCLNYMRQIIMCRGDLELESFQYASHHNPIDWRGVYECKDWEAVFKGVKENQAEHRGWPMGRT